MIKADMYYLQNLSNIRKVGTYDENPRPKWPDNGAPAHSKFITQVFEEYDIANNEFPITTLRHTAVKTGIREILWIYQAQTSQLKRARDLGVSWWESWNIGDDTIGQRYGATIAKYNLIDELLENLRNDPFSRRHIVNMYQYSDLLETKGLFPCAYETIWSVRKLDSFSNELVLDLTLIQRSNDYLVAGYINKIQYVALQMMIASDLGYKVGKFCHFTQNLHVYDRHFEAMTEIEQRQPLDKQPIIRLKSQKSFYEFTIDDFEIINTDGIEKLSTVLEIAV